MKPIDYISKENITLTLKTTIGDAKQIIKQVGLSHLPVLEHQKLIGLITCEDILTLENDKKIIDDYNYLLVCFTADENQNLIELLSLFASNQTNFIPVLDVSNNYIGYYELEDILHLFNETPFLNQNGYILIIEKNSKEYSFSQISQIIESNNIKLLGLYISSLNNDMVQITLKVITEEINNLIQTFRRYNYNIINKVQQDKYLENLKERSIYLKKYLNI